MDKEDLMFLLRGGHIDMSERIKKRIWPHTPIPLNDCINVIVSILDRDKPFPHPWVNRQDGELIDDAATIEKINETKFIFHYREASPNDLRKISINRENIFKTAESAAEYYLRNILRLPGDLDGWKVI